MSIYYSPTGNPEMWDYQPEGYFTVEEWERSQRPPLTLEEAKAIKIIKIDVETSEAILGGFEYTVQDQPLHFSYRLDDQQNFADTANAASFFMMGVPGVPSTVTWNGYKDVVRNVAGVIVSKTLVRLTLTPEEFLSLYMGGALVHKATQMEIGGQRKAAAWAAQTFDELADV